jgi:hypothetical protein
MTPEKALSHFKFNINKEGLPYLVNHSDKDFCI